MFYESPNHLSRLFIIVEKIMINDYILYVSHHVKLNVVYFIIYLISRQHNFIIWHLEFLIFRASNEKETWFIFLFFRSSIVPKRLIHIFYVYFINAFNCDFCVKFVNDLHFLLSTFVMYAIVTTFLIILITFSCAVDNVLSSQQCVFSHNRKLNST